MGGVYIHIPFCTSKCPYCDFYSLRCGEKEKNEYVEAVIDEINTNRRAAGFLDSFNADTIYLGGGTPSVLKGEDIRRIVSAAKKAYGAGDGSEITVECNPSSDIEGLLPYFKSVGVNRVSLGMQSAVEKERRTLGRTSDKERILKVVSLLKNEGITNISLDVMLGIPFQTEKSLEETLEFANSLDVKHISAYILKLEEGTFFYKNRSKYDFPDDDAVAALYEKCCDFLKTAGFVHYEISNFAKPGYKSRHNTKYWLLDDYLGIGAAAHSFINGKRFYYNRSVRDFCDGKPPVFDDFGGGKEEYIMLRLRLEGGVNLSELKELYGDKSAKPLIKKAPLLKKNGFINFDGENFSLTEKGFLVSNSIISEII